MMINQKNAAHLLCLALFLAMSCGAAFAQGDQEPWRQAQKEAWWTGPIISMSPDALPKGHVYFEPYLYNVHTSGQDSLRSRTYMLFGLTDRVTVGAIPIFGFNSLGNENSSNGPRTGDFSLLARYQLTKHKTEGFHPSTALALEWSLPTGKHDRLKRLGNGMGVGTSMATLRFLAQDLFWAPNGRIIRTRFGIARTFPGTANVDGVSVYNTAEGFSGWAKPGASITVDNSWEYSLSRSWALALDLSYTHSKSTYLSGLVGTEVRKTMSGASDTFAVAPAIEYSWSATQGILAGVRIIPKSKGTQASITPVVAISLFF